MKFPLSAVENLNCRQPVKTELSLPLHENRENKYPNAFPRRDAGIF